MEESSISRVPSRGGVSFLNVARTYIPNTKVECHYTLPPGTVPSASDWIGIFKVEAACVRDYHTFVWSSVPESATDGSPVHASVQFQASYLPKPGAQLYQFRYVNRQGRVCGQSPPFQFREPRPMDELVTLEETDGGSDILLVVPKATVLQNQLDESQQERNDLMQLKLQLEGQVTELRSRVQELETALATARQEHAELKEQYKGLSRSHGELTEERDILSRQQGDHVAHILELEDDIQIISEKVLTKEVELDRVRDTVKALTREQEKLLGQLKEVQADKEQSEAELQIAQQENRRLNLELQEAKGRQEEQGVQTQRLKDKLVQMKDTLSQAQQRVAELEPLKEQLRGAQELAASSQQKATLLGEELASAAGARDRTIAELHRSRLEVAGVNGRLAELSLHLKEEKSQWSKERAGMLQSVEAEKDKILKLSAEILRLEKAVQEERTQNQVLKTELAQEKDASLVQLSEGKRELTELRSALRVLQKEKEQLQEEKQELLEYMRKLEARLEKVADEKWNEDAATEDEEAVAGLGCPAALTDSEDESPEDMRLPPYGLCERGDPGSSPAGPREASPLVVISQPAPIAPHLSGPAEDSSSDSEAEDEKSVLMAAVQNGGEEANLLLPELGNAFYDMASTIFRGAQIALHPLSPAPNVSPTTSGFAGGPLSEASTGGPATPPWKECPICRERFPAESDKDALEDHMDGHFFFSTQDPFTFE
ncbi:PREDICTED: calcium-binding and coiled-coil domain-containing protein 1 isoform X1 [Myotis davidii]|uniref:calcium-binding and coiled-coil domain-containing protein 1 isoform X1 n=1 Tax=Myotis davidii TaxID=225400 RepID=UPI0003EBDC02|nr:PREDICTED: calcium-binding and coiled-coil domain-containing protein 1 isoform X1 [Myotis davidii]XP_006757021.1 PREDICTED: calcium-binding and coiled-coil domain-containing protein 1 isoform X1 [Myotis davidii]XP_015415062.1 PREDICTED: calcium-binding and coiled-coil domain-containing protein 1 isoform X1 [Myotis davidii]